MKGATFPPRPFNRAAAAGLLAAIGLFAALLLGSGGATAQPPAPSSALPIGGCQIFPADNIWNRDISELPGNPNSPYLSSMGLSTGLHADFGAGLYNGGPIGIPYTSVPNTQPQVPISFDYWDQSDPGPYPIPTNVPIEGGSNSGGDRHALIVHSGDCKLYEIFALYPADTPTPGWTAGSGAVYPLNSNQLRPNSWTSADAAGLPIIAGLARYDEVAAGSINHALRFTANNTRNAHIWPARHDASGITDPNVPPMGLRVRLKASVNISTYPPQTRIVLTALKHYGMILADNGSDWFISGAPDDRWNNDDLHSIGGIHGSDFEVVDESSLMIDPNSGAARQLVTPTPTPCPGMFVDVCPGYWAYNYIIFLAQQGIMGGYPGNYFYPENPVNRAQFAKILTLAEGWQLTTPASPSFTDVPANHWAYTFVETVHAHNVIAGYPDGSFRPNNLVSRGEIAKMVTLAHSLPLYTPTSGNTFSDVPISNWAFTYAETVNHAGIMTGIGGGRFGVNNSAKRSETARIIYVMLQQ